MNLHDAIDQDVFTIENEEYTDTAFQKMTVDDLETMRLRITKKINGLSTAIAGQKIDYANGGKGSSKDSYLRHRSALTINQRVLTYVNTLIKKHLRESRTISDYFMDQAKINLPRKDFELILSNAHQKMEESLCGK